MLLGFLIFAIVSFFSENKDLFLYKPYRFYTSISSRILENDVNYTDNDDKSIRIADNRNKKKMFPSAFAAIKQE